MTTIAQLPPAASVSDSDEIAIYQNGQTLSATRGQMIAGTQPALSLPANTLLGNVTTGAAAPSAITIGANLAVSGTTLSAMAPPFVIPQLAAGRRRGPPISCRLARAERMSASPMLISWRVWVGCRVSRAGR